MWITIPGHVIIARRCKGQLPPILSDCLRPLLGDFIPGHLIFARRCKGQLPPIFPDCLEATLCRLPFRVMSLLHGGARGSYRQFFRTVLRSLLGDVIPGHLIFARRRKEQLPPILSDYLETTSWRFHPGPSHFCTVVQGAIPPRHGCKE